MTCCSQLSLETQNSALKVCDAQGIGLKSDTSADNSESLQTKAICQRLRADAAIPEYNGVAVHHKAAAENCQLMEDHYSIDAGGMRDK